jgi:hypothetical protein
MKPSHALCLVSFALVATSLLASCGGGGGGGSGSPGGTPVGAAPTAIESSGAITAFGSVFVDGREFAIGSAKVVDDDQAATAMDASSLEVGMSVDVDASGQGNQPVASLLHVHPLARGPVDASDSNASTLTVMGQSVQLTAATLFSDHRACLRAATSPCSAVQGQTDLAVTSGSGSAAVAGSFVTVYGYLYAATAGSGADIVATLVSVNDLPGTPGPAAFKAEGVVTAASGSSATIGGLTLDLASATCYAGSGAGSVPCAGAFSVGQIVSAVGSTEPSLPAASFQPGTAFLRNHLPVQTDGTAIDLEGKVSSVTTSPAGFMLRGVSVDASALASGSLPAAGDLVRVTGTVAAGGTAISASAVKVLHAAITATYGFEGDAISVAAGSSANTYVLSLLGQSITVDADTRLGDASKLGMGMGSSTGSSGGKPFNLSSFQTYLAASPSQHLRVSAQADATGALHAMSVVIEPASPVASVGGTVDASPAPVNGSTGTPTTFSVHGLAVSAASTAVLKNVPPRFGLISAAATVAAGDLVEVRGSYSAGVLSVSSSTSLNNFVVDSGPPPKGGDRGGF